MSRRKIIKRNKAFLSARLRECGYKGYGEKEFVALVTPSGYGRPIKYLRDCWIPKSLWRYY